MLFVAPPGTMIVLMTKVSLSFYGKRPGPGMRLDKLSMQFSTQETERAGDVLEAYERLILDAMRGDHTLFTTADGIELEQLYLALFRFLHGSSGRG